MINKKGMALTQVFLLLLAIFAFAFLIGLTTKTVSAVDASKSTTAAKTCADAKGTCINVNTQSCTVKNAGILDCDKDSGLCCVGGFENLQTEVVKAPPMAVAPVESGNKKDPASKLMSGVKKAGGVGASVIGAKKTYEELEKIIKGGGEIGKAAEKVRDAQKAFDIAQAGTDLDAKIKASELLDTTEEELLNKQTESEILGELKQTKSLSEMTDMQIYFKEGNFWTINQARGASEISTGGYIGHTAAVAAISAAVITTIFKMAGSSERNTKQISTAAWTAAAATTTYASLSRLIIGKDALLLGPGLTAGIVVGAALVWSAITYQDFAQEQITYKVGVWQPEDKGERCNECNGLRYGCSEYQCKTYGAACGIVNPGTEFEECIWENEDDIEPPIISPLPEVLDDDFKFTPETTFVEDRGVKLVQNGGCLEPFHNVYFGVKTDEPAQCKIDVERKIDFDEMSSFMVEGSVYTFNHTLELPSSAFPSNYSMTEAGWTVNPDDDYSFFIRCKDPNGNLATHHFVVNFCVDDGPDTTAPTISTNYLDDAYITSGQSSIDNLEVYTNEPADCRWDHNDKEYDDMEYEMSGCSQSLGDYTFPKTYSYGCNAVLTGLVDDEVNKFYIRCKDKPGLEDTSKERRVANEESYVLKLEGTKELVIDEITVNDEEAYSSDKEGESTLIELADSTNNIKANIAVKTSQGAGKTGGSRCYYSELPSRLRYEFYNEGSFDYNSTNTHDLYLDEGFYDYDIQCCDLANNCDSKSIQLNVDVDTESPEITRAYYEAGEMKLVTNEEAKCAYALDTCNFLFEDGITFNTIDNLEHYTSWDTSEDLYVKCKDDYGNIPADTCSIIVRATDKYSGANKESKDNLGIDF